MPRTLQRGLGEILQFTILARKNSIYGFRVGSTGASIAYTNGTGTPGLTPWATNTSLTITEGHGGAYPLYNNNVPRNWNGTIHYLAEGCSGIASVDAIVLDCSSLIEFSGLDLLVYPNPNNGSFFM